MSLYINKKSQIMHRIKKFLRMIFIFYMVFFIICDEKWYKIEWKHNHIVLNKNEEKSENLISENITENKIEKKKWPKNIAYKNSELIRINYEFSHPRNLRNSNWLDKDYADKLKQDKKIGSQETLYWPNIITLNENEDIVSNAIQQEEMRDTWTLDISQNNPWYENPNLNLSNGEISGSKSLYKNSNRIKLYPWFENPWEMRKGAGVDEEYLAKLKNGEEFVSSLGDASSDQQNSSELFDNSESDLNDTDYNTQYNQNTNSDSEQNISDQESVSYEIDRYEHSDRLQTMSKWKDTKQKVATTSIWHDFMVESAEETQRTENWLSDSLLESLLDNEEIDIDTLESENDEFLQKLFKKTKDKDVMNLIVETYLNEYQFIKAKKFIESLSEEYYNELNPSLNLRVAFNSFSLGSKTITENLKSILRDYSSKGVISNEDVNRYWWVIALMDRNYDKFFEISNSFISENNKSFATKLKWYKNQIEKQMWIPDYYFDTLVSLELFNQWLFQPAKVLALHSLQQNSSYILPHQVLAYANFLTNSRDTSIEYLKKLEDLDPNNAEKYRFLMWIAFYRDEKYEQSVVMLSMIKDEKLRLDTQRYLINDYIKLNQKNKLISSRNKLLWYEKLVDSDFYTYFYETFFHPYSEWEEFQLYAYDTELANKMLRICSVKLQNEEKSVCTYWSIGKNIALWEFDGMEQYLINLVAEYPQWYLYQALWEYYIQQWKLDKAKVYLIKAISLSQKKSEISQIKRLLQDAI